MSDKENKALVEALKIAKNCKNGVPIQIQNMVKEVTVTADPIERKRWANEVARWLFSESNKPGIDQFSVLGYSALQNALAPFIPEDTI
ncbi:MAG: hypothetical protein GIW97_02135 [Candidatus Eremiobacteraeota bacterium]|nr:hypothetical protein [Candidatus Eremiobacteraeota bacterium]